MRKARIKRKTEETCIDLEINLDGAGKSSVSTTVPFLDHMLSLMARHGIFDLKVSATGDTDVDYHHLVEDIGIVLGEAIKEALGKKKGICRYGNAVTPMDETLAQVVIDLSGRPYLVYKVKHKGRLKDLDASLFEDFFQAVSNRAAMNLHILVHYGRDMHHVIEAIFKSFGRALDEAVSINQRIKGVMSTKGSL